MLEERPVLVLVDARGEVLVEGVDRVRVLDLVCDPAQVLDHVRVRADGPGRAPEVPGDPLEGRGPAHEQVSDGRPVRDRALVHVDDVVDAPATGRRPVQHLDPARASDRQLVPEALQPHRHDRVDSHAAGQSAASELCSGPS